MDVKEKLITRTAVLFYFCTNCPNKCNAILFCLIKNFISFHFFFQEVGFWSLALSSVTYPRSIPLRVASSDAKTCLLPMGALSTTMY